MNESLASCRYKLLMIYVSMCVNPFPTPGIWRFLRLWAGRGFNRSKSSRFSTKTDRYEVILGSLEPESFQKTSLWWGITKVSPFALSKNCISNLVILIDRTQKKEGRTSRSRISTKSYVEPPEIKTRRSNGIQIAEIWCRIANPRVVLCQLPLNFWLWELCDF